MKVHSHYDPKFRAEEAFSLESVDDVPVDEGDVLSAQQVGRFKADYGDDTFKVEPAFELIEAIEGLDLNVGEVVPASRVEECSSQAEAERCFVRAKVGGSDAFIDSTGEDGKRLSAWASTSSFLSKKDAASDLHCSAAHTGS